MIAVILGLFLLAPTSDPIVFQSLESKTENGSPVFNRVKFIPGWEKDVWQMQQTHHGFDREFSKWDKLEIVVDKKVVPYQASFYQFGDWGEKVPYKARCFACHANGPRTIRPDFFSSSVQPSFQEKVSIFVWNWRIKTYGRVTSIAGEEFKEGAPFKSVLPLFSRPLGLESCTRCHSDTGIRNALKLEHLGTALFMVKHAIMPPFPFRVTAAEESLLEKMAGR